jgi:phosphotransferase system enzyme I (PtsI)
MLGDAAQFVRLRGLINEAIADLPHVSLRHGALFEVPAAGMEADEIMREADFGSIGTNDLLQYLCAVDRTNDSVANEYTADRPAFWSLLRGIVRAAAAAGKPLSVCGELAGDPHYTSRLLEIGIRSVSVSPRLIARVRAAAQQHLHTGSAVPAQVQS